MASARSTVITGQQRPTSGKGGLEWTRYARFLNNYYPGMLKNYASRTFPMMFSAVWLADSFGVFSYWNVDMYSGPGTNSWEDSFA